MPKNNRTKRPPPRRARKPKASDSPTATPSPGTSSEANPADEATDAEGQYGRVEVRLRVMELLGAGYSPPLVVEQLMQQPATPAPTDDEVGYIIVPFAKRRPATLGSLGGFGLSRATAWRYVKHVREQWEKQEPEERPFQRARCIRITEFGLRGAAEDREWSAFRGLAKDLADLFGLRITKVEVNEGGLDALIDALKKTPSQVDDRLAELEAKAKASGVDLGKLADDGANSDPSRDR